MSESFQLWVREWLDLIVPVGQVVLVLLAAMLLQRLARRLIIRAVKRYGLPAEISMGGRRLVGFAIYMAALLMVLERLGVSATVLWTAFTGFAAVGAVAFFAAWSVLSNVFCTVLIFTSRPFRLYDFIELLENGEKPGLKGRVVDINLIYTTLEEVGDDAGTTILQIPNNIFFQRTVRRWRSGMPARPVRPAVSETPGPWS